MSGKDRRRSAEDEALTRREAQVLTDANDATLRQRQLANDAHWTAHERDHDKDREALEMQMGVEERERKVHERTHDREHEAHTEKHEGEHAAVLTALAAVDRERVIHTEAHDREHYAHAREHQLANLAIDKAEAATDNRFKGANAFREQLDTVIRTLATKDTVTGLEKDLNRRYEDLRLAVTNLEKGDVKSEGRTLGQGAVIAAIIGAISLVGTILGILIVVSNVLTKAP